MKVGDQQLEIVQCVGVDWKRLGLALHFDYNVIEAIESSCLHQVHDCCCKLLHKWLNGEACQPVTWARLIEALRDAKHSKLAKNLMEIFISL